MKTPSKLLLTFLSVLPLMACRHASGDALADCRQARSADAAISACTQVIDSKQAAAHDRAQAYSFRGGARQSKADPRGAIADLDAALALAPDDPSILANRGSIYNSQNQPSRGIPDLLAAIRIDPNNELALGNLALVYERRGDWAHALALVDRVLKLNPKVWQMWGERCWIGAASDANPAAALPDCGHALELEADPNIYNSRGLAYYRAGRFAEAIADYDRSIQGNPNIPSSFYMRGKARQATGVASAQEDIDKGIAMEPGVAQRYAGYGVRE